MTWRALADWWVEELLSDAAYEEVVTPLLLDVLRPQAGASYVDLGSGEGRLLRTIGALGAKPFGLEINHELASRAGMLSVVGDATATPFRQATFDGAYVVLVIEHIGDHVSFFQECSRLVTPGGVLALVANHPIWTAPGSTPITDDDGEVLWRPGEYFSHGTSQVPAADTSVLFHHRSTGELLNAAAAAGWCLDQMIEQPHHELSDQSGIPRLAAFRWTRRPMAA